jgi:hypothetical protein
LPLNGQNSNKNLLSDSLSGIGEPLAGAIPASVPAEKQVPDREVAIRTWLADAIARELPRLGESQRAGHSAAPHGSWIKVSKEMLRSRMRPGCKIQERVLSCLLLHTAGYHGELAVRLSRDILISLTSYDIRKELNQSAEDWAIEVGLATIEQLAELKDKAKKRPSAVGSTTQTVGTSADLLDRLHVKKQDVRRALAGLEAEGNAVRALRDGRRLTDVPAEQRKGLQERDVLLLCPCRPFQRNQEAVGKFAYRDSPFLCLCRETHQILKLLDLPYDPEAVAQAVATDAYLKDELTAAVEGYRNAVSVAKIKAKERISVVAESRHIKKKELQKKGLKTNTQNGSEPPLEIALAPRSHWQGLLFAAKAILMDYTEAQLPKIRTAFESLPLDEQRAAIDGLKTRAAVGQYDDPKYIPQLARYVSEKLWTGVLRVSRGRSPATDRKAAARQEFEKRLVEEMADARREIHD